MEGRMTFTMRIRLNRSYKKVNNKQQKLKQDAITDGRLRPLGLQPGELDQTMLSDVRMLYKISHESKYTSILIVHKEAIP